MEEIIFKNGELHDSFNSALRSSATLKAKGVKWISVKDNLPEHLESCLCYRPSATFDNRRVQMFKHGEFNSIYPVTHWMPLPDEPNQ